ncbi:MAG: HNH endonuclease signature motif containing protein [Sulfuricaulis sp.]
MPTINCAICGTSFHRAPSRILVSGNFCSDSCRDRFANRKVKVACGFCGRSLLRSPSKAARKHVFCDKTCHLRYKSKGCVCNGYRLITVSGKQVLEHRWIVEQHLGRKLIASENVHHINGNKLDNRLSNLTVMSRRDHSIHHTPLTWDIKVAESLYRQGASFVEIAKKFGVTRHAIRLGLISHGIHAAGIRPRRQ